MDLSVHQSGAAAAPPAAPASPSVGYPTPGNPATGTPASVPGAYWRYQLQEEMAALLTAAGLTASHTNLAQVLAAVRAVADARITYQFGTTDTTPDKCSLTANGWQVLPSGLIIQWGIVAAVSSAGWSSGTYPIAFPTAVLVRLCTAAGQTYYANVLSQIAAGTNPLTQFNVNSNNSSANSVWWLAIGH